MVKMVFQIRPKRFFNKESRDNQPAIRKKIVKLDLVSASHMKANSRWNADFNTKNEPIKILERNLGEFL